MKQITSVSLSSYQKIIMVVLALTQFTVVLDFMVMSPLGDILMKSLTINPKQFGIAVSAYAFSAGLSGLLAAGFADNYDRKKILLFFYVGFVVGTFFCGIAQSYETLVIARIVTGIFGGVISSITMAIITDVFDLKQRGKVMGIVQMGFAASQVLGIPIGLYLAEKFNWHAPFLMIVGFSIVILLVIYFVLKPVDEHLKIQKDRNVIKHFKHVLLLKNYRIAFLATAFLTISGYLLMPFGSAFAVNNLGIPQENMPMVFLFTGITSLIIMPIIGKLSDKYSKNKIFTIGSVWAMIVIGIYVNLGVTPLWLVILFNVLMFMGIMSRLIPSGILTSAMPQPEDRGAFMSVNSSLQQIAGGLATVFAGLIIVQKDKTSPLENYPIIGYLSILVMLICIWFTFRVSKIVENKD